MNKNDTGETGVTENSTFTEGTNPRIGRMVHLMEEVERQHEKELLRGKRIKQEQECIDRMLDSMNENLRNNQEEQKINEEFELRIRNQVYRMHGISEDKLEGMEETKKAWYQGAAFALFLLSVSLTVLCGVLHGFESELCIFMAFYTAIEGALLSYGRKRAKVLDTVTKTLYMLLFPAMMTVFVCFELGFAEYNFLVPVLTIAGLVILALGVWPNFMYDPYRLGRRSRKKANGYLRELEKLALKEVKIKERELEKLERKKEKRLVKEEKKQQRLQAKEEKKQQRRLFWEGNRQRRLEARESSKQQRIAAKVEKLQQREKKKETQQAAPVAEEVPQHSVELEKESVQPSIEKQNEPEQSFVEIEEAKSQHPIEIEEAKSQPSIEIEEAKSQHPIEIEEKLRRQISEVQQEEIQKPQEMQKQEEEAERLKEA